MITVSEAVGRISGAFSAGPVEVVALSDAAGRVLAEDLAARRTQPPVAVSAMDGWAVRCADVNKAPVKLKIAGQSVAGKGFSGNVGPGHAVRIFTGAPVPDGADGIVIQEDASADPEGVILREAPTPGRWIRAAGLDFATGKIGLTAGRRLTTRDVALAAAMNIPWLPVRRAPRIALLATGDELVRPGEPLGPAQIVNSNSHGLAAMIRAWGGQPVDLGIAPDRPDILAAMAANAVGCDLLVTLGGASVGEHDLVQKVLADGGASLDFWRIAMRPGKPLMFGRTGSGLPLLGLPGNPVSALVCGVLFLRPAIAAMLGANEGDPTERAVLGCDLVANDSRQDYLRSKLSTDSDGRLVATPFPKQDSSMLSLLAAADCLAIRPIHAPAAKAGEPVDILRLAP